MVINLEGKRTPSSRSVLSFVVVSRDRRSISIASSYKAVATPFVAHAIPVYLQTPKTLTHSFEGDRSCQADP